MPNESSLWLPQHLRGGQKRIKVVFYRWALPNDTFRITVGAPEQFPAPKGAEKIVCESAADVDRYSQMIRDQEKADAEMSEAERYEREEPTWKMLRQEMLANLQRAKSKHDVVNTQFCEAALAKMDEMELKRKEVRISFQHAEAFEDGK